MGFIEEFTEFLEEYGVLGLAIAFVVGLAVKDLVNSVVEDLIMPFVEALLPNGAWDSWTTVLLGIEFRVGSFMAALMDFLIIALLVFVFVKYVIGKEKVEKIK